MPGRRHNASCSGSVRAQLPALIELIAFAHRHRPDRKLDLVLLTIGANDIRFSGLVADVIIEATTERVLFGRGGHLAASRMRSSILDRQFARRFARLRGGAQATGRRQSRARRVRDPTAIRRSPRRGRPAPAAAMASTCIRPSAPMARTDAAGGGVRGRAVPPQDQGAGLVRGHGTQCRDPASERMTFVDGPPSGVREPRLLRPRRQRPGVRPRLLFQGRNLRHQSATAATQPLACGRSATSTALCATRALGAHRQRQLFHRHDLSAGRVGDPNPPTSTTPAGACCPPSTAAPSTRPPRATPPWRTPRCRRCVKSLTLPPAEHRPGVHRAAGAGDSLKPYQPQPPSTLEPPQSTPGPRKCACSSAKLTVEDAPEAVRDPAAVDYRAFREAVIIATTRDGSSIRRLAATKRRALMAAWSSQTRMPTSLLRSRAVAIVGVGAVTSAGEITLNYVSPADKVPAASASG